MSGNATGIKAVLGAKKAGVLTGVLTLVLTGVFVIGPFGPLGPLGSDVSAAQAIPAGGASTDTPGTSSSVGPSQVAAGESISFSVSGFPAGETVHIKIDDGSYCGAAAVYGACVVHMQAIDGAGNASGSFQVPSDLGPGTHWLRFLASTPDGVGYTRSGGGDFTVVPGGGSGGGAAGSGGGGVGAGAGAGGVGGAGAQNGAGSGAAGAGSGGALANETDPLVVDLGAATPAAEPAKAKVEPTGVSALETSATQASAEAPAGMQLFGLPLGPVVLGIAALLSAAVFGVTLLRTRSQTRSRTPALADAAEQ